MSETGGVEFRNNDHILTYGPGEKQAQFRNFTRELSGRISGLLRLYPGSFSI